MRYFSRAGLCLALAVAISTSAHADDDLVVVNQQAASVSVAASELLANDGIGATITQVFQANRGTVSFDGVTVTYTPTSAFADAGSDSFQYQFSSIEGSAYATVFLIADLKETLVFFEDFSSGITPGIWTIQDPNALLATVTYQGDPALEVTYSNGTPAYLSLLSDQRAPTVTGGNTEFVIDPGAGDILPGTNPTVLYETVVASGIDGADEQYQVVLRLDGGDYVLYARGRQMIEGQESWRSTQLAVFPAGRLHISLTWWAASEPTLRDGGVMLSVNEQLVGWVGNLANYNFGVGDWLVGNIESHPDVTGSLLLDSAGIWSSAQPAALPPLFAHGFESGQISTWGPGALSSNGVTVSAAAALSGAYGLEIPVAGGGGMMVIDESPKNAKQLRLRFLLRVDSAFGMPTGETMLLAAANDAATEDPVLRVELQQTPNWMRVRAVALLDDGTFQGTQWRYFSEGSILDFRVHWWSQQDTKVPGGEGGLRIWGNGNLRDSQLNLENGTTSIEEVHFGAAEIPFGSIGVLSLDDYESWQ